MTGHGGMKIFADGGRTQAPAAKGAASMVEITVFAKEWYELDDSEVVSLIQSGWSTEDIAQELLVGISNACQGIVHVKVPDLRDFVEGIRYEVQPQGPDPEPPDPMYVYKCYIEKYGLEG